MRRGKKSEEREGGQRGREVKEACELGGKEGERAYIL